MTFSLTWLPDVLKGAGLKVAEVPGWQDRGAGGADMGQVLGVLCHHTGIRSTKNMPTLNALINGRAAEAHLKAIPGPLAQLGLGRDGTFFVIAAGKANHAGTGMWRGITSGNTHFIGDPLVDVDGAIVEQMRSGGRHGVEFHGRERHFGKLRGRRHRPHIGLADPASRKTRDRKGFAIHRA